jgi:hypothetical protein
MTGGQEIKTGDRKFFLSGDQIILPFSGDQKFK